MTESLNQSSTQVDYIESAHVAREYPISGEFLNEIANLPAQTRAAARIVHDAKEADVKHLPVQINAVVISDHSQDHAIQAVIALLPQPRKPLIMKNQILLIWIIQILEVESLEEYNNRLLSLCKLRYIESATFVRGS